MIVNEKIGRYTEDEILEHLTEGDGRSFLGRSMYDAIFDKIHALKTENEQLKQENSRLKDKLKDIKIILNSNHDVEHIYCALSQYLNIFDYELDLEDYLKEN